MIVIADTTPINYLVLIGEQELLPALFGQVIIPEAVFRELLATATPQVVRQWLSNRPQWLEIRKATMAPDTELITPRRRGERGHSAGGGIWS